MIKKHFYSITATISLIIITGFVLAGLSSFFSFQTLFEKDVETVSQLTSENIYVNINNLMERPINVSIAMAHDTFLRDFIDQETDDGLQADHLQTMKEYLTSYQKKYNFDSVFFVSSKTGNYYHYKNGIDRVMTHDNPENVWYYDFLEGEPDCSLNVDNDETKDDVITIFVNCKLFDEKNNLLGVVGVGMETPYIQQFMMENEQKYGVHAYLIDADGNIQISSQWTEFERLNLFVDEPFQDMSAAIDTNTKADMPNQQWYHSNKVDGYIITRYIPNLNWYLVVEKNTETFQNQLLTQLLIGLLFMLLVIAVVIVITTTVLRKYDLKLHNLAEIDQLTGLKNRTSYEREIQKYKQDLNHYEFFAIGAFDLNNLKLTNDLYGHLAGDEYIKSFATLLHDTFEHFPVFRMGGDEFCVILVDLPEVEVLRYWNQLKQSIESLNIDGKIKLSAAFGYAYRDPLNLTTIDKIVKTADDNMYLNKAMQKLNL